MRAFCITIDLNIMVFKSNKISHDYTYIKTVFNHYDKYSYNPAPIIIALISLFNINHNYFKTYKLQNTSRLTVS